MCGNCIERKALENWTIIRTNVLQMTIGDYYTLQIKLLDREELFEFLATRIGSCSDCFECRKIYEYDLNHSCDDNFERVAKEGVQYFINEINNKLIEAQETAQQMAGFRGLLLSSLKRIFND